MGNTDKLYDERCRLAIEGSEIGVFDWNVDTGECFFSERWLSILGYSKDEVKNEFEEWIKIVHPDDIDGVMALINEHLEGRTSIFLIQHRVLSKNEEYKWITARGSVVRNDLQSNNSSRVIGTIIDIDDRKKFELYQEQINIQQEAISKKRDIPFIYLSDNIEHQVIENNVIDEAGVLRNRDEYWQCVLELTDFSMWEWNIQTGNVSYSEQWKKMLGYKEQEIENSQKELESRIHPDDLLKFREGLAKYLHGEIPVFQSKHRMQCKDGNYIWTLTRSKIIHWSKDGTPLRLIGVQTNLGGIGLFPESYKYGEFQDTILVNGIEIAWNTQGGICTFRGLPVAMMWVDTTLANLMSAMEAMVGSERFALALQAEGRKSIESDWLIVSLYPDFRDGFAAITVNAAIAGWGDWQLFTYDHEQKTCVFRVYNNWEGLYQKSLGVNWGSGILAGKLAGICSKLFGTNCWATQTQFVANGDKYDEFIVNPSNREIEKEIENLLVTDQATRADMAIALQKLYKNEQKLKIQNEAIIKSQEKIKSHNDHLLKVEKEKNDALKEAIKLKDEFFYLITHEFKTPITVIDLALQAIEYGCKGEVTEKVSKYLNTIKLNVNRQIRLVTNLLDIVKINSGHLKIDMSYFNIMLVLEVITNSVQLYAEQKNVKLKFNNKLSRTNIYSDEEKLERIMLNLLSNALKFTPNGKSITVTLSSKKHKNKNMILISVQDEGMGIPPDKQEIIFERFGQVDNSLSRQAEGTGLGLHLVKLLVTSIGGEISCESVIGKGSTFTLLIPIIEGPTSFEGNTPSKNENMFSSSDNRIIQSTKIEFSDIYF